MNILLKMYMFFIFILGSCDNKNNDIMNPVLIIPEQATSYDFREIIKHHITYNSDSFIFLKKEGSEKYIKHIVYQVAWPNPVYKTTEARLTNENLQKGESRIEEELKVFRIYIYKDKIIGQNKHCSSQGLIDSLKEYVKNNEDMCVIVSFEDILPISDIWDILVEVYECSKSRVVLVPDIKTLKEDKMNEDIR